MKMYVILSRSLRQQIAKDEVPALTPAHREYHNPMRQHDLILLQAMMRPDDVTPKGSRLMILQAETREEVDDFIQRNPLMKYDAMEWTVHELLPNYAASGVHDWFKGIFSKGHGQ
jgi:hypothetical protein